jgi:transposase
MPRGGSTSPLEKYSRRILALVGEQRDLTLDELVSILRKRRISASRSALSRFFARRGITFKKLRLLITIIRRDEHSLKKL